MKPSRQETLPDSGLSRSIERQIGGIRRASGDKDTRGGARDERNTRIERETGREGGDSKRQQHKQHKQHSLAVAYCNVNWSDINTHAFLEAYKYLDFVLVGEPRTYEYNKCTDTTNRPAFRRVTPIDEHSQVVGYAALRHKKTTR